MGSKPLSDPTSLKARIVRRLLIVGVPMSFCDLRMCEGMCRFTRAATWRALRELVDERVIDCDDHLEADNFGGFMHSMTYPVFWVPREATTDVRSRAWWRELLAHARGEGVPS